MASTSVVSQRSVACVCTCPPPSLTAPGPTCTQAPQAGEVVTFKVDEGGPVEYGQVVIELAPFFGGHIIGDSKYA